MGEYDKPSCSYYDARTLRCSFQQHRPELELPYPAKGAGVYQSCSIAEEIYARPTRIIPIMPGVRAEALQAVRPDLVPERKIALSQSRACPGYKVPLPDGAQSVLPRYPRTETPADPQIYVVEPEVNNPFADFDVDSLTIGAPSLGFRSLKELNPFFARVDMFIAGKAGLRAEIFRKQLMTEIIEADLSKLKWNGPRRDITVTRVGLDRTKWVVPDKNLAYLFMISLGIWSTGRGKLGDYYRQALFFSSQSKDSNNHTTRSGVVSRRTVKLNMASLEKRVEFDYEDSMLRGKQVEVHAIQNPYNAGLPTLGKR